MTTERDLPRDDDPVVEMDLSEVGEFLDKVGAPGVGEASVHEPEGDSADELGGDSEDAASEDPADESDQVLPPSGDSSIDDDRPRFKLKIPGYEIVGVVGRGATGIVYRARQIAVDRKVALKVLHPELITNRRAVKRLQREARLAAKLAHPSIISAIDMGKVDGQWWYAMELVEGVSLSRRIAERGTLTEREVLRLFSPLCDALQHAHEGGVVHRDIKPANILIDRRGRARLVDLGLAIGQNDPSITRTGATLGTPHYVSPEQARDPRQADIRSDIWSAGATMYHAACGRPPFHIDSEEDSGVAEILSRVLYEPVTDPREFVPTLSKGFALMLRKCLTRDPQQRYQEPWELVADIELLRERRRLDLRGSQLDHFASRRPAWLRQVLAAGVVCAAIAATWAITARPWEDRPPPVVATPEATLRDWPELLAIDEAFKTGRISHAGALTELDSSVLQSLPESARFLGSELLVAIQADLEQAVKRAVRDAEVDVDRQLLVHDFAAAAASVEPGLADRLRASTGYEEAAELPPGGRQRLATQWERGQRRRIRAAHDGALEEASKALHAAYPRVVRVRMEALLEQERWRDALRLLSPEEPGEWLQFDGVQLDLRGMDDGDRSEIARSIADYVRSDASHVKKVTADVVADAQGFLRAEVDRLISEINSDRVMDEVTATERLARSLDAKHATLGLDIEQLTSDHRAAYRTEVEDALASLASHERRRRDLLAQRGLRSLERSARPLLLARRYGDVRKLYQAAHAEGWRVSTIDIIAARLREIDMLEDVLVRAAEGVTERDGENVVLKFVRIPERGLIEANGSQTERLGFQLKQTRGLLLRVTFREAPGQGRSNVRVLEVDDVLHFAGLDEEGELGPADQLAAAAFLAAEGRPKEARSRIRLEDYPASDPLPADLEARVRPLIEAARDEAAQAVPPSREVTAPEAAPRTFMEVYGVPNQTAMLHKAHLVWHFADDSTLGAPLLRPLATDASRVGTWTSSEWRLRPAGFTLDGELAEHSEFLAPEVGPTLALGAPLRADKRVTVRVEMTPDVGRPDGHLISLSVLGYHALIVDEQFKTSVWVGTGDFRALCDHVVHGTGAVPKNFSPYDCVRMIDGEPTSIEIEVRGNTLEKLLVGGVAINVSKFQKEPRRADPYVRIRSRKPITVHAVEVYGERR